MDTQDQEVVEGQLGSSIHYAKVLGSGNILMPYFRTEFGYDFGENESVQTLDNSGTPANIREGVEFEELIVSNAVGISYQAGSYQFGAEYEYKTRGNYQSHTGQIKDKYLF